MKQAGVNATEAKNPVNVCYGKVTSETPLKISVEQKITLGTAQLELARNVTDYNMKITIDNQEKIIKVHNGLKVGEEVLLIRKQGGQKYIVMDRMV
jgi:hypothetical protein